MHQLIGQIGLLLTIPKMLAWAWRLECGPVEAYDGLVAARIPMIDAASGSEINWAIEHIPVRDMSHRQRATDRAHSTARASVRLARLRAADENLPACGASGSVRGLECATSEPSCLRIAAPVMRSADE